jgi:hypothetical protein
MKRKDNTSVISYRVRPELRARIERRAALEGVSAASLSRAAMERYLGTPASRPFRLEFKALLYRLVLCGRFLSQLLEDRYGDELKMELAEIKAGVVAEVHEIFENIDLEREG